MDDLRFVAWAALVLAILALLVATGAIAIDVRG